MAPAHAPSPGPRPARPRVIAGWTVVILNLASASLWAFWGAIETFHEGWWHPSLADNLAPMLLYLSPAALSG